MEAGQPLICNVSMDCLPLMMAMSPHPAESFQITGVLLKILGPGTPTSSTTAKMSVGATNITPTITATTTSNATAATTTAVTANNTAAATS